MGILREDLKTYMHLSKYLAEFFLERELFRTTVVK